VTITGLGFVAGSTTVKVAGSDCTSVSVTSSTQLTCVTPSTGSAGAADVVVYVLGAQPATLSSGYTYF